MKKFFTPVLLALLVGGIAYFLFDAAPVLASYADELNQQLGATAGKDGAQVSESADPRMIVALLIRTFLTILGTLYLAYTVYAGYLWMTAAGDDEQINTAKATLRRATLGVVIVLMAYSITRFVTSLIPTNNAVYNQDEVHEQVDAVNRAQQGFINDDPLNQDINRFEPVDRRR